MATQLERPLTALDVIFGRRSVRAFRPDRVDESTVRALLDAAVQAPTAMHQEPWVFVVVQNPQLLARISARSKQRWLRQIDRDARLHDGHARMPDTAIISQLEDPRFNIFYDAPTLIVIGARGTEPFVVADCWLAAENLMLAASALGLGTCCVGSAVIALNDGDLKADLGIPGDVTAIVPIALGVPAGATVPVSRREPEIVSWT